MSNHYPSSSGEKLARTTAKVTNMAERKSARGAARNAAGGPQGETSRFSSREARKLGRETGTKKAEGKLTSNAISLEGPRVPSSSRFLFSSLFLLPSLPPPPPTCLPIPPGERFPPRKSRYAAPRDLIMHETKNYYNATTTYRANNKVTAIVDTR